jgi:hypothetical protein
MLRKLRAHLSFANVTSMLALFVALGGTSAYDINEWNSSNIQDETLLSADIKNGTLKAEDYGIGSVSGARIQDDNVTILDLADGAVFGNDVRNETLTGSDIRDGTLDAQDIGETVSFHFPANIGTVNATSCVNRFVTGLPALGDLLLLTPNVDDAHGALIYDARYDIDADRVTIHVCNFSNAAINDGTTHFNLLVSNTW